MASDPAPRYVHFGDFQLDLDRGRLWRAGELLAVSPRTLDTLIALVRHRDRVVEKSELLDLVWSDANVEESNLSQQVFTLRRLLGDDTEQPRFIATLPRRGYRFIADVVEATGEPDAPSALHPVPAAARVTARRRALRRLAWPAAAACAGLAAGLVLRTQGATATMAPRAVTFEVELPGNVRLLPSRGLAGLSPDGRMLAFVAESAGGAPLVFVRALESTGVRPVPETEHAMAPFWSLDGTRLGFFAGGKLRTVPLAGGPVVDVCDVAAQRGGTWGADGTIVFAAGSRSVLYKVPAQGGTPVPITRLDPARRDISHRFPSFLKSGRQFLFQIWAGDTTTQGIYAGELGSDRVWRVSPEASPADFTGSHMLFVHREALVAQPLDPGGLRPSGEISTVASPVARDPNDDAAFSATSGGIAYVRSRFEARLVWRDRSGREIAEVSGPGQYDSPAISPDGRHILFAHRDRARGVENLDVWMADLDGRNRARLTFDGAVDIEPVVSPDGRAIVFRSNRSGFSDLYRKPLDTTEPASLLYASKLRKDVDDWSPDGRTVLFTVETPGEGSDLWTLPLDAPERAAPLISGPGWQSHGRLSPDGALVAYQSTENDVVEIFVQSLGASGPSIASGPSGLRPSTGSGLRWRIGRGVQPMWRGDGQELLFVDDGAIMAVALTGHGDSMTASMPRRLFDVELGTVVRNAYAVTPDGQRFLIIEPVKREAPPALMVLLDSRF